MKSVYSCRSVIGEVPFFREKALRAAHHAASSPLYIEIGHTISLRTLCRILEYVYLERCYTDEGESSQLVDFCERLEQQWLTDACVSAAMDSMSEQTCLNCYQVGRAFAILPLKRKAWRVAVEFGLLAAVTRMARDATIINTKIDWDQRTALHVSVEKSYGAQATALIQTGADVNAVDHQGKSPLGQAAWLGDDKLVERLLEANADVHSADQWGQTALHKASSRGHVRVTRTLLDRGARVDQTCKSGYTALHLAAMGGENVTSLVFKQANPLLTQLTRLWP